MNHANVVSEMMAFSREIVEMQDKNVDRAHQRTMEQQKLASDSNLKLVELLTQQRGGDVARVGEACGNQALPTAPNDCGVVPARPLLEHSFPQCRHILKEFLEGGDIHEGSSAKALYLAALRERQVNENDVILKVGASCLHTCMNYIVVTYGLA